MNLKSALTLDRVMADFGRLPASPDVTMELLDYLQREEVDAAHISHLICRDQTLAAKALRIANSSFYGLQCQVVTIHDAMVVLGLRAVHTLITTAAIAARMKAMQPAGCDQHGFWLHSVGTALCAQALARQANSGKTGTLWNSEKAFTAGLLHDIGSLVLAVRFPEHHAEVLAYRDANDCLIIEAEHEVLGFDHAQVGGALALNWKFSDEIVEAVAWHHTPEEQPASSLAGLTHLADIMAHALNFPGGENDQMPHLSAVAWNRFGLTWQDFKGMMAEVDARRSDTDILTD
jgi:putative nucleotidyltransferase with HDIG domain